MMQENSQGPLLGKVTVITGGTSGLGKSLARTLFERGSTVVTCARDREALARIAQEIGVTTFVADVTKREDVAALADFTVSTFGRIDVWINNAGIWIPQGPIEDMDVDRARPMFDVNVFGMMYSSQVALAVMLVQRRGTIVNIVSTSGLSPRPLAAGYAASKWAARGFTDSLREGYRDKGIRVIGVYPGGIKTELFGGAEPEGFETFMSADSVAEKIVANLEQEEPLEEQIIRRPSTER